MSAETAASEGDPMARLRLPTWVRQVVFRYLRWTASQIVVTHPIRRVPGWWSGYPFGPGADGGSRIRHRLWKALRGRTIEVTWYDGIRLEILVGTDISRLIFVGGELDPNEFAFLADVVKPGMTVVDIGANEGLYTLFLRSRVGEQGQVIAFEPSVREFNRLARNLELNCFNNVMLHQLALGDHLGPANLHVAEPSHAGHNALGPPAANWVRVSHIAETYVTTLDSVSSTQAWPPTDLIKIDVEGLEAAVLRGAENLIERDQPIILFEAEPESLALRGENLVDVLEWLRQRGYSVMEFSALDGALAVFSTNEPFSVNLVALPSSGPNSYAR